MLWDPDAHEPLVPEPWDEGRAGAAIREIALDAEDAFADGWPAHPPTSTATIPARWGGLYLGGAGVVDALRRLAERDLVELRRDYLPYLEHVASDLAGPEPDARREPGILLVRHRLVPSSTALERLCKLIADNAGSDARELLLGSPGTMLVARELGLDDLWRESAEQLLAARDPETGLWDAAHLGQARRVPRRSARIRRLRARAGRRRERRRDRTSLRDGRGRARELAAASRRNQRTGRSASSGATELPG